MYGFYRPPLKSRKCTGLAIKHRAAGVRAPIASVAPSITQACARSYSTGGFEKQKLGRAAHNLPPFALDPDRLNSKIPPTIGARLQPTAASRGDVYVLTP